MNSWCGYEERRDYSNPDNMDLEGVRKVVEQLRGGAKGRLSYDQIRIVMSQWAKWGVYQTYTLPEPLPVHRARRLEDEKWFKLVQDLGNPKPEETVAYGRCHQPKHPLCYCSLYEDIALAEINAELGKRYAIATFTMPKDIVLIQVGELDYFRRTGSTRIGHEFPQSAEPYKQALSEEDRLVASLIDAFLADEFIRPATTQVDYKVTSALSDVLLNGDLNPSIPIDAIAYPSVAFRDGLNFAIRTEAVRSKMKLDPTQTRIVEITDVVGYGIFTWKELAILKSINSDGILCWEELA